MSQTVKPIILAKTVMDFGTLFATSKQALGYSPNRVIDSKNINKDAPKVLTVLNEFLDKEYQYSPELDGLVLDYFNYVIGVVIEEYVLHDLLHYRAINILSTETIRNHLMFVLLSGTLRNFRELIIDASSKTSTPEIRLLSNNLYNLLISEGLNGLWSKYSKSSYDGSMILLEKK